MAQLPIFDHSSEKIPISVITGFLGSGKTTLLNKLLKQPSLQNTAIIVNEFGAVSFDHLLVRSATEDIVVMNSGCICCTVRGDLAKTLQELFLKRTHLEIPEFTRVIIETTGLADPAPIIHTLLTDVILQTYYCLDSVVTTIDSVYGLEQLGDYEETVKQAAVADRLILTKTEITPAEKIELLKRHLERINPAAPILTTELITEIEFTQLFNASLYNPKTKSVDVQRWLQAEAYHQTTVSFHHPDHSLRHDRYIETFCFTYQQPLSWKVLNRWFQQLTALRGKDLLRVKGIVYTLETDLPVIVQGVQHIFQPPTTLPAWPTPQPCSQLVFITRNIKQSVIEQMLDILLTSKTPAEACTAALLLLQS
jgi:G3E family GTPase